MTHPTGMTRPEATAPLMLRARSHALTARVHPARDMARPALLALHGIARNDEAICAAFAPLAARSGQGLIVPRFDTDTWPRFQRIDKVRPDLALISLLDAGREGGLIPAGRINLFGYSGGAQLAHRFAMLYPRRVATLHVAAPGWFCLPDPAVAFPQGLKSDGRSARHGRADIAALMRSQLSAYLALPVRIYVGADDDIRDPALRADPEVDRRQGTTRLARAQAYLAAFRAAAKARGLTPDITLTVLPGCAHDFTQCARTGGLAARVLAEPVHA